MAALLTALPALFQVAEGIIDYNKRARAEGRGLMARQRKMLGMHGGRMKRRYVHHDKVIRNKRRGGKIVRRRRVNSMKRGKGFFADLVSNIPIIGNLAGPLLRGIGAGTLMPYSKGRKLRGAGLAPMYMAGMQQRLGNGLLAPAGYGMKSHRVRPHYRYVKKHGAGMKYKRVHVRGHRARKGGYMPYTF